MSENCIKVLEKKETNIQYMGKRIICPSIDCNKTPKIEFKFYGKKSKLICDCGEHKNELELNVYLKVIEKELKNKKLCICTSHQKSFSFYCKNCNCDYCQECEEHKSHQQRINFSGYYNCQNSKEEKMAIDISGINLQIKLIFEIIINEYKEACYNKTLNYSILYNYTYIINNSQNILSQYKSIYENESNCYYIDIKNISKKRKISPHVDNSIIEEKIDLQNLSSGNYKYASNNKYIIYSDMDEIYIYSIKQNEEILKIKTNSNIIFINTHPLYENIFLTIDNYLIIWEISLDEKICYEKTKIKNKFNYAIFSPTDEFIFITLFLNQIKIWQLDKPFCLHTINTSFNENHKNRRRNIIFIDFSSDGEFLVFFNNNNSIINLFNIKEKRLTDKIEIKCNYAIMNKINKNQYYLIIINNEYIIKKSIPVISDDIILETQTNNFCNYYYNSQYELLYIFNSIYNFFKIIDIKRLCIIFETQLFCQSIMMINAKQNNKSIFQKFFCYYNNINNATPFLFILKSGNIYKDEKTNVLRDSFEISKWDRIIKIISDISILHFSNNFMEPNEIKKKNYLQISEINEEVIENYKSYNLKEKRIISKSGIEKFQDSESIDIDYLNILKLMIKNNTNIQILQKYLKFLQNNEKNIKEINKEYFKDEINFYKIAFSQNELMNKFNFVKNKSEFDEFLLILHDIDMCKCDKDSLSNLKTKYSLDIANLSRFNQPIQFSNNELYWYRNRGLVLYCLNKITLDKFKLMKYCVGEKIIYNKNNLKDNIFNNYDIMNDKTKLTFILLLIVLPQDKRICNYNINLLNSKNYEDENKLIKKLKSEGFKSNDKENYYFEFKNKTSEIINIKNDKSISVENVKLNVINNLNLDREELYNYEYILNKYSSKIIQIKNFLGTILQSKLFKEIFGILYPNDIKYPFTSKNDVIDYLDNYLNFIPLKSLTNNGATDKFTCEVYIFLKKKYYYIPNYFFKLNEDLIKLIKELLYTTAIIKTNFHETNHNFYNYYYFSTNNSIPLKTPRKKDINLRESGRFIELLMFNQVLHRINISQALYILNENNYNKTINEFNEGFNLLKEDDLKIEGVFHEFNLIGGFDKFLEIDKETMISTEPSEKINIKTDYFIEILDENDVLGV